MVSIVSLWLPVLVAAVFVFIASSLVHTILNWHANDYVSVPDEESVMNALRPFNLPPGEYAVPKPESPKQMKDPAFIEKMGKGPVLMMTVWPNGQFEMGKSLVQWFIYCVVVSVFAAYITGRALEPGAEYLQVFRFAGATAFFCHAVGLWQSSIWFRRSWVTTAKNTVDGLIYALLTAGTFGWLWPS